MSDYIDPSSEPGPDDGFHGAAASFQALSLNGTAPPDPGFQGQSSSSMLVKAAVALKSGRPSNNDKTAPGAKPWPLTPWRESSQTYPALSLPDPHLLRTLLSLYFTHFNRFVPLLHRPTFERSIEDNMHFYRQDFAHTVLLVCALGSLHLPKTERCQELAWKWYDQVELCGSSLRCQPTIYDLQAYCLAAHFQLKTCDIRTSWLTIGFGIRIAEDIGAHRRNLHADAVSTEGELETRAAWYGSCNSSRIAILLLTTAAFMLDAQLGIALGRQIAINPFDLDIRLASECDDGYWDTIGPGKQPPHTPSSIVFFNCSVMLYRILHFLVKNLYSTSRFYTAGGVDDLEPLAQSLETRLRKWFRSIPPHLTWNSEHLSSDNPFFDQSASLHCFYHYLRLLIRRPFINVSSFARKQLELDALRTCIEAARAVVDIADTYHRQTAGASGMPLFPIEQPLFTAAVLLILKIGLFAQRGDHSEKTDLERVRVALEILMMHAERWPASDFYVSVLERLLNLNEEEGALSNSVTSTEHEVPAVYMKNSSSSPESWISLAEVWMAGGIVDINDIPESTHGISPVLAGEHER
ncbi:Zn(2)-C6 fungal-type domain-containing protein [Favolaschia claudopus]|uniref:Zn(2)-C6 fungal-type domain-containing protein n=1 Tax=Favolaschia claudopus TaxID=2862362 RepID=A0AAW0AGE8_9AGAR